MKITEWFARAVAAGVTPDWNNIWATFDDYDCCWTIKNMLGIDYQYDSIIPQSAIIKGKHNEQIQLRKDGKDLCSLEWRKPTEIDIGKMCWFANENSYRMPEIDAAHTLRAIDDEDDTIFYYASGSDYSHCYCLLADHNQIAPTESDFKQFYGD